MRGDIPAAALKAQGFDAAACRDISDVGAGDHVVFLKPADSAVMREVKARGARVYFDVCDNKFDEKEEYLPCAQVADCITVNTQQQAREIKELLGRECQIVTDPYERPLLPAKFQPQGPIKLLWFGSGSSLKFVPWADLWARLEREIGDYHFTLVTSKTDRIMSKMQQRQNRGVHGGINFDKITAVEWSWELQGQLLAETDIVFIPVMVDNYRTDTKSANRVIDSIISGRFVVTTPLASYTEFSDYTWQDDYVKGIQWARNHPQQVIEKIARGQEYVQSRFSPAVIAEQWLRIFNG